MRRKTPTKSEFNIERKFMFSWTKCDKCKAEVKWERMWVAKGRDHPPSGWVVTIRTLRICNTCAQDVVIANNAIVLLRDEHKKRPKPPQPPPKPVYPRPTPTRGPGGYRSNQ